MKRVFQICISISILELIIAIAAFQFLPETIPTHWDISGKIDAYGSKWMIFLAPLISLLATFGMYFLPKIDPKGENIKRSGKAYPIVMLLLVLIMVVILFVTIFAAFGYNVYVNKVIPIAVGILFILLGNYMPKIKPNYFFGIRLPWTIANEMVWAKTHRVGGFVFFIMGLLFLFGIFVPVPYNFIIPTSSIFLGIIILSIYSYLEYEKVKKN